MAQNIQFLDLLNPWWQDSKFRFELIERPLYKDNLINRKGRLIDILIGARRTGKTYILYSVINTLLDKGVDPRMIVFLTAEQREIKEMGIRGAIENITKNLSLDLKKPVHIFIDEIQEVKGWQQDIKFFYDITKIKFYLTGSSSLILAEKTSKLTGRFLLHKVFPLNFSEYLSFKKIVETSAGQKDVDSYLNEGGYPEYILTGDQSYLRQSIESTLYRDLISVYGIRNPAILEDLLYYLADKLTTPISVKRIKKDLKVDDETAKFYLKYLADVFLIYPLYRYGRSNRISKSANPKYYFNDNGVLNIFGIRPRIGHLMENAVYLKLLQGVSQLESPRIFYDVVDGTEIDFTRHEELFEVKAHDQLGEDLLERYVALDKKITIIVNKFEESKLNYHPNLKIIAIKDFLQS